MSVAATVLSLVAALDRNRAIGRDGDMPWHLPDDLARFKRITLGKPLLMGRKTALAIGRALPGRRNLVLSRSGEAPFATQETVSSLDAALALAAAPELMVIGGGEIYALALPLATRLYLTEIDAAVDGADTWFPEFDRGQWQETRRIAHPADQRHACSFEFVDYEKKPA
ncbi:dihydrofolate reductase [Tahibacter aquaticus]|uniref:Dihydrofolate reductase n=1 Tax=Tahibacter aquaticus TaxID=520092 RepID=A0A4R6Z9H3_9GAMM|nr:dihydrofolate reductase [Tahibacter aquaticus]TDR48568.1 dihydrofolate reductase [Tahibacter aquaticus]